MKLSLIKKNPTNPRVIKDEKFKKLVTSLKDFPKMLELRPIVINSDGVVLGGNMRLAALQELGYKDVPDEWVKRAEDLTDEQQREFIIKDNIGYGEWDFKDLANNWNAEDLGEWGLDLPEIVLKKEAKEDDFDPSKGVKTDIQIGDIIEIGRHKLFCGDSTTKEAYEALLGSSVADCILTDPPYNVNYEGRTKDKLKITNDDLSNSDFHAFLLLAFSAFFDFLKPGGACYVWHADTEGLNFRRAFSESGLDLKQCLVWVKNTFTFGRQDYQWQHEPCLYGWKPGAAHHFTPERTHATVLFEDKPNRSAEHPTMKPVGLMGRLISNSTLDGQIILDPFVGSGTTMVAAHQLGRVCYAIEMDPTYCQVVVDRMLKLDASLKVTRYAYI